MVVGMLGILKAGGAYMPDPSYPCDRLRFMLEDSQVLGVADAGEVGRKIAGCGERSPSRRHRQS